MKMRCLLVNPVSNGKYLAEYLIDRGIEVSALIELERATGASLTESQKRRHFDPALYSAVFTSVDQVLKAGLEFTAILPGSECGVETSERLARLFGLAGNDPSTTALRQNKFRLQNRLEECRLASIKSVLIDLAEPNDADPSRFQQLRFPIVLKPVASAAMEDVSLCEDWACLEEKIASTKSDKINCVWTRNTHFVAQEFIEGTEYALDFMVHAGAAYLCVLSEYVKNFKVANKWIATESVFHDPHDPQYEPLIVYGKAALNALGVTDGPVHAEFIVTPAGEIYLIDIGARLRGGEDLSFYESVYSCPPYDALFAKYFQGGAGLHDSKQLRHSAHAMLNTSKGGSFEGLSLGEIERLSNLETLRQIIFNLDRGEIYVPTSDLLTAVGFAAFVGESRFEVKRDIDSTFRILEEHLGYWRTPLSESEANHADSGEV